MVQSSCGRKTAGIRSNSSISRQQRHLFAYQSHSRDVHGGNRLVKWFLGNIMITFLVVVDHVITRPSCHQPFPEIYPSHLWKSRYFSLRFYKEQRRYNETKLRRKWGGKRKILTNLARCCHCLIALGGIGMAGAYNKSVPQLSWYNLSCFRGFQTFFFIVFTEQVGCTMVQYTLPSSLLLNFRARWDWFCLCILCFPVVAGWSSLYLTIHLPNSLLWLHY